MKTVYNIRFYESEEIVDTVINDRYKAFYLANVYASMYQEEMVVTMVTRQGEYDIEIMDY